MELVFVGLVLGAVVYGIVKDFNPQAVLARGYAILTTSAGQILRRAAEAAPGQHLTARLSAGALDLTVNHIVSEE